MQAAEMIEAQSSEEQFIKNEGSFCYT